MALDATRVSDAAISALKGLGYKPDEVLFPGHSKGALTEIVEEISKAIIDEFVANAIVNTNITVTSVSGVTTGTGVSGPGAGTGVGGIT